jgi:hypothetical protein
MKKAALDAVLHFRAQCRTQRSRACAGRSSRGARRLFYMEAYAVPFGRRYVERDVVHDEATTRRKAQLEGQVEVY